MDTAREGEAVGGGLLDGRVGEDDLTVIDSGVIDRATGGEED